MGLHPIYEGKVRVRHGDPRIVVFSPNIDSHITETLLSCDPVVGSMEENNHLLIEFETHRQAQTAARWARKQAGIAESDPRPNLFSNHE